MSLNDTYEIEGSKEVWIRQNEAGMDKRFCTLELCFHPGRNQPRPGVVFRGKGKRISAVEKALWDPRVFVMFKRMPGSTEPPMIIILNMLFVLLCLKNIDWKRTR